MQDAYHLGFGKAASGSSKLTLFLDGQISNVPGLYRSTDGGSTWVRINDDAHQYGEVGHVTGDPRRFGRVYFASGGRGIFYGDPVVSRPGTGASPETESP